MSFELTRHTPPEHRLTWTTDTQARKDLEEEMFGKRVLITDRDDWPIPEVVAAYHSQSGTEALSEMKEAIRLHLDVMRERDEPLPEPSTVSATTVDAA
ncbi:MAG: hypothetical protein LC799_34570 [Actinobacteria bacterium]|nr:hypothetical protein [Actinomycetota bacterium]